MSLEQNELQLPPAELPEDEHAGIDGAPEEQQMVSVSDLRAVLAPYGCDSVLVGLREYVSERVLAGRLVEMGPCSSDSLADVKRLFSARVAASACLTSPYRADVLAPLYRCAMGVLSPYRRIALEVLAPHDPAAASVLRDELEGKKRGMQRETHEGLHRCMGHH